MKKIIIALLTCLSLATSINAADVTNTTLATGTTDTLVVTGIGATGRLRTLFCGFSARETVGSASSTVNIYAGTDATGRLLFTISLAANESRSEGPWYTTECMPAPEGIFVDRGGSGSTLLVIFSRSALGG